MENFVSNTGDSYNNEIERRGEGTRDFWNPNDYAYKIFRSPNIVSSKFAKKNVPITTRRILEAQAYANNNEGPYMFKNNQNQQLYTAAGKINASPFCGYNQSVHNFDWTFEPGQYASNLKTMNIGEVGVFISGGTPGNFVPRARIDAESYLTRGFVFSAPETVNPKMPQEVKTVAQQPFGQIVTLSDLVSEADDIAFRVN